MEQLTRRSRGHLVSEAVFRSALTRERRRADRSNLPFVVLVLHVPVTERGPRPIWRTMAEALAAASRDSSVLGWVREGSTMAVIQPEGGSTSPAVAARELSARVTQELRARLAAGREIGIDLYVHPAPAGAEPDGLLPVDPLLHESLSPPAPRGYQLCKRALDVSASAGLLLFFSPLLLVVAAAVKATSPGPVFFRQMRIGQFGKPFRMLKFRTMHVNVDEKLHQEYVTWFITSSAQAGHPADGQIFKLTNDPRITRVGNFLRKTSLDELPQLWNVVRGDMSLVGPRPPLAYEVEQYQPWHWRRVREALPGITGLWQVSGRSRTTFDEMVRLDLRYARTHSILNDLKILLATPRAVISGKGAC